MLLLVALQIEPFSSSGVTEVGGDGQFVDFTDVRCLVSNPPADIVTRWLFGTFEYTNSSTDDRHTVTFHPESNVLNLKISNLGYADNGTYVCGAKSNAESMWMWNSVELILQG